MALYRCMGASGAGGAYTNTEFKHEAPITSGPNIVFDITPKVGDMIIAVGSSSSQPTWTPLSNVQVIGSQNHNGNTKNPFIVMIITEVHATNPNNLSSYITMTGGYSGCCDVFHCYNS